MIRITLLLTDCWTSQGMQFSHEEAYAMLDLHEEGRMVTRVHYVLTKEEYLTEK